MATIYRPKGRAAEYSHLALNHYIGCNHGCKYCYVPAVMHNEQFFTTQSVKKDVLWQLRREAPNFAGTNERVLLCFSCDPYQSLESEKRITSEVIKILRANDIPFQVLTKGGMRAVVDFDQYGKNDAFADRSREFEPNAASPRDRIRAIEIAKQRGINTWVSLEPVLDVEVSLQIIKETHEFVDLYKIGMLNHYPSDITAGQWRKFAIKVIELCRRFETDYYIKKDMAKYLDGVSFCSVDTRKVKRPGAAKKPVKEGMLF